MRKFAHGDAGSLAFPDETFDFVAGAQVYCFMDDILHAIKEAARVLHKAVKLFSIQTGITRRMIENRRLDYARADLPRELPQFFRAAGLTLSRALTHAIVATRYDTDAYSAGLIDSVRKAAIRQSRRPRRSRGVGE